MSRKRTVQPSVFGWLLKIFLSASIICIASSGIMAQERQVSGTVSDNDGPLIGVNILVEGTTTGTITDFDGNYTLTIPEGSETALIYKFVGYKEQKVVVGSQSKIDIKLEVDAQELEEVVVVGYGEMKKKDLTGSVEVVDTEELTKFPVTNVSSALQGRVSGVFVSSSAEPGASPSVNIRGVGSINSNSSPLYVVDGVQLTDISGINPSDIASMQVLKDASSSAIYGSRAANGVIIITTKSGRAGEQQFSINVESGVSMVSSYLDMMDTEMYAKYVSKLMVNGSTAMNPQEAPAWTNNPDVLAINTDWQDETFQMGVTTKADLSLSGGSEKSTYRVSLGYINQSGTMDNTGYERYNLSINSNQKRGIFTLGINSNMYLAKKQFTPLTSRTRSIYEAAPQMSPYDATNLNGLGAPVLAINGTNYTANPLAGYLYDFNRTTYGVVSNLYSEIQIIEGLSFRTDLNVNYTLNELDKYTPIIAQELASSFNHAMNSLELKMHRNFNTLFENYFKYNKTFGKHSVNAMAGISARDDRYFGSEILAIDLEEGTRVPQHGQYASSTAPNQKERQLSYLGRVNYNYDDRYLFTASVRRDGSSNLSEGHQWRTFPSFSLGWVLSEESFLANANFISNLKLRAGYGELGRSLDYMRGSMNTVIAYPFADEKVYGTAPMTTLRDDLTWETVKQTNIGVDLGLWNNDLTVTAEYFIRNSSDMLMLLPPAGYSGYRADEWINAGALSNKGTEFSVSYRRLSDNGFEHTISANATFIKNKVDELPQEVQKGLRTDSNILIEGEVLGALYGLEREGINSITGAQIFKDQNGDGEVNLEDDRVILGNPHPTYYLGLSYNARYKNVDFSIFFQGAGGHQIYNHTRTLLEQSGVVNNRLAYVYDQAWDKETNPDSQYPIISTNNNSAHKGITNDVFSDRWVEDGDYLRLKNIQIGYNFSEDFLKKVHLNRFRVYISGTDLWTLTGYSGLDPTNISVPTGSFSLGVDNTTYPAVATVTAGIQIGF